MKNLLYIGMQDALTYRYEKHHHSFWEITYYYCGEGQNITGSVSYDFKPGTIICQPPDLDHEDVSPGGYKNIFFTVEYFDLPSDTPIILQDTFNMDFLYILRQLYNEYYSERDERILNALLYVLNEYLLKDIGSDRSNRYVQIMKRQIISNISKSDFSILGEISKYPISFNHFRRLFLRETGMSPQKYLQTQRIDYAKRLLKNSSRPIYDICYLCGYADPYYFSRIFKSIAAKVLLNGAVKT